ncbi:MAG: hypothetical protein ACE37E_06385 [Hyphomicrobiales bacterium]
MTNRWIRLSLALAVVSPLATSALAEDSAALEQTGSKIIAIDQDTSLVALADGTTLSQRSTPSGDKLNAVETTTKQENARYRAVRG